MINGEDRATFEEPLLFQAFLANEQSHDTRRR